jgi:hypothetical protein
VPLFVHDPEMPPATVDDVVSTRHVAGLLDAAARSRRRAGTLLDPDFRRRHPDACAEHFHYAVSDDVLPQYRQNSAAVVVGRHKIIVRHDGAFLYDLRSDPGERAPARVTLDAFADAARGDGYGRPEIADALSHLRRWSSPPAPGSRPTRRGSAASVAI